MPRSMTAFVPINVGRINGETSLELGGSMMKKRVYISTVRAGKKLTAMILGARQLTSPLSPVCIGNCASLGAFLYAVIDAVNMASRVIDESISDIIIFAHP